MKEVLTHLVTVLVFLLLAYLIPASKGNFSLSQEEYHLLKKEFRKKEIFFGITYIASLLTLPFLCAFVFYYINYAVTFLIGSAKYIFIPELLAWTVLGAAISFGLFMTISKKLSPLFFGGRSEKFNQYSQAGLVFKHGIDPVKFEKSWKKLWFCLSLFTLFCLMNWNFQITENKIRYREPLSFKTIEYDFSDITAITSFNNIDNVVGKNKPGVVYFSDGNKWQPSFGLKSGSDLDSAFIFLSEKSGVSIASEKSLKTNSH